MTAPSVNGLRSELATTIGDHVPVMDGCACGYRIPIGVRAAGFAEAEWAGHVADELTAVVELLVTDSAGDW